LCGKISDKQLITELDEAAAFVLPCIVAQSGDRDGIPVALMEAMAMETVPVSTQISGIPELIRHGESGFLTKPKDTKAIVTALQQIITNPNKTKTMAGNARETVTLSFTTECQAKRMESVFQRTTVSR